MDGREGIVSKALSDLENRLLYFGKADFHFHFGRGVQLGGAIEPLDSENIDAGFESACRYETRGRYLQEAPAFEKGSSPLNMLGPELMFGLPIHF